MQAVTIYVLIRLEEGETDDNNMDFLLITAVTVSLDYVCPLSLVLVLMTHV
jgi:hypothetical protein